MRLVVVDAHPWSRDRLKAVLGNLGEIEVLAFCADARSAFVLADALEPDVFLIDPVLMDADGYAVIRALRTCVPACAVVAFTDVSSTRAVLNAFGSGAQAFVLKTDPTDVLLEALRAVFRGEYLVSETSLADLRRELLPDGQVDQSPSADRSDRHLN
jgi:DNA-binding NarL/FixJ family response regulator